MSALVIPNGFELIAFSWDCMPPMLVRASRTLAAQPAMFGVSPLVDAAPHAIELTSTSGEEEAERWDGLS